MSNSNLESILKSDEFLGIEIFKKLLEDDTGESLIGKICHEEYARKLKELGVNVPSNDGFYLHIIFDVEDVSNKHWYGQWYSLNEKPLEYLGYEDEVIPCFSIFDLFYRLPDFLTDSFGKKFNNFVFKKDGENWVAYQSDDFEILHVEKDRDDNLVDALAKMLIFIEENPELRRAYDEKNA